MGDAEQTLRQLATQDVAQTPICIRYPTVKQLVVSKEQIKACGICLATDYPTHACPQLHEDVLVTAEDVNTIGGFQGQPQQQQRYFNNNFGNQRPPQFQNFVQRPPQQQFQQRSPFNPNHATSSSSGMSLEDIVKNIATNTLQFQQKTDARIQNLGAQMTQLATSVSRLESQGKLPSQTKTNPKQNVSAIVLRSGKELEEPKLVKSREVDKEIEVTPKPVQSEKQSEPTVEKRGGNSKNREKLIRCANGTRLGVRKKLAIR